MIKNNTIGCRQKITRKRNILKFRITKHVLRKIRGHMTGTLLWCHLLNL